MMVHLHYSWLQQTALISRFQAAYGFYWRCVLLRKSSNCDTTHLDCGEAQGKNWVSVWPVSMLHAICGMVSVGSQLKYNSWVQSWIDAATLQH